MQQLACEVSLMPDCTDVSDAEVARDGAQQPPPAVLSQLGMLRDVLLCVISCHQHVLL